MSVSSKTSPRLWRGSATRRRAPARRRVDAWGWRLLAALVLAGVAGYLTELVLGNPDPRRVGWSASYVPVIAMGAVFAYVLRGVGGALLSPLPILFVPETWVRVRVLTEVVGLLGLVLLLQPLPVMWVAGAAGALAQRVMGRRSSHGKIVGTRSGAS
ncbi:MAG: hypothetical protein QN178_12870 [Armatimonadota bacterium]|nr:hypothetical protein [Armatimonadota bacterium]